MPSNAERDDTNVPASVELDEDITVIVEDDLLKLLANQVENRLILNVRDGLGLQLGLELVVEEERNLLLSGLGGELLALVEGVLKLLLEVLDDERGPLGLAEVEGTSVVAVLDSVDPDKVDLALVLGGDGLERVDVLVVLLVGGVNEEVGEGLAARGVGLVVLRTDLIEDGNGEVSDPTLDVVNLGAGDGVRVLGLRLVERAEDDNGRGSDTSSRGDLGVGAETEEVVVAVLVRGRAELGSRCLSGGGKEGESDDLVRLLELLEVLLGNLGDRGERLPVWRS